MQSKQYKPLSYYKELTEQLKNGGEGKLSLEELKEAIKDIFSKNGVQLQEYNAQSVSVLKEFFVYASAFIKSYTKGRGLKVMMLPINCNKKGFTKKELSCLQALHEYIEQFGGQVRFKESGFSTLYSITQSVTAYQKINELIERVVADKTLSPAEQLGIFHSYASRRPYRENAKNSDKARNLISVLTGKDVVCVGYCKIMEVCCNMVGIPCAIEIVELKRNSTDEVTFHAHLKVFVTDTKYGLNGFFNIDSCFDCTSPEELRLKNSNTFSYFLLPPGDYIKHKNASFYYTNVGSAFLENSNTTEIFMPYVNYNGQVLVHNSFCNNLSTSILTSQDVEEVCVTYGITLPQMECPLTPNQIKLRCKAIAQNRGIGILKSIEAFCPSVLQYPLDQEILAKAYAFEMLVPHATKERYLSRAQKQILIAKEEFYNSLITYAQACNSHQIQPRESFTTTMAIQSFCVSSKVVNAEFLQGVTKSIIVEQILVKELSNIERQQSAPLTLEQLQRIISKTLNFYGNRRQSAKEILRKSIAFQQNNMAGGKNCLQSLRASQILSSPDQSGD